jgi:hypothetical protein
MHDATRQRLLFPKHFIYIKLFSGVFRSSLPLPTPIHNTPLYASLDSHPRDSNDNIHALLLRARPFVAVCPILLVVPVRADSAVHAAAAVLLGF